MVFRPGLRSANLRPLLLATMLVGCGGSRSAPPGLKCVKTMNGGNESGGPIAASGSIAYVGGFGAIALYDLSNPANPVVLQPVSFPTGVSGLAVAGKRMLAAGGAVLVLYDLSDPKTPVALGQINTPTNAPNSVVISGTNAFVGTTSGNIGIYDISGVAPKFINQTGGSELEISGLALSGTALYAGGGVANGMMVFDMSDPAHPQQMPTVDIGSGGKVQGLATDHGALFAYTFQGVGARVAQRFDLSAPLAPKLTVTSVSEGTTDSSPLSLQVATDQGFFIVPNLKVLLGWNEDKIAGAPDRVGTEGTSVALCIPEKNNISHVLAVGAALVITGSDATGFYAP
jgi:hypothetical protein